MNLSDAIYQLLSTTAEVAAEIGSRLYPKKLPQKPTYPAAVFDIFNRRNDHTHDGPSGFKTATVQITALALTNAAAEKASRAIEEKLDGFTGLVGTVNINGAFHDGEFDDYDDELKAHWFTVDYEVTYSDD